MDLKNKYKNKQMKEKYNAQYVLIFLMKKKIYL